MFNNKKLIYDLYTKNKIEVQSIDGKVVSNSSAIT